MSKFNIDKFLKRKETKHHKITNSFNIKKIFQEIRRNKFYGKKNVDEATFYTIIKEVNLEIVNILLTESSIDFPKKLGVLYLVKYDTKVYLKNNKVYTNKPVDWKATYTLWKEDEECYKNKILVRLDRPTLIKAVFSHYHRFYKNTNFMAFRLKRELKKKIHELYYNGELDVYKT